MKDSDWRKALRVLAYHRKKALERHKTRNKEAGGEVLRSTKLREAGLLWQMNATIQDFKRAAIKLEKIEKLLKEEEDLQNKLAGRNQMSLFGGK